MKRLSIETPRLLLKGIDAPYIHHCFNNLSTAEIQALFGLEDISQLKAMHEQGLESYRIALYFFLIVLKAENRPIGQCGFHTWNTQHHRADVFYHLYSEADWNKGYLSETLPKVIEYGFETLDLHRIQALVADYNTASVRLIQKSGFVYEGRLREDYWEKDTFENSDCYSLLKREWQKS